LVSVCWRVFTF